MTRSSKYRKFVALITFILLSAGVSFFVLHIASPTVKQTSMRATIHCVDTLVQDFTCHKRHFQEIAQGLGLRLALEDLKTLYASNPFVYSQCHQLSHAIGNVGARTLPDIADAFALGDPICWSGYYHGVVEEYITMRGRDIFAKEADTFCAKIPGKAEYSFDYYNCVHGLGHGVMAITHNQLFDSLALCDNLSVDWDRRSCYGGVFMENVMAAERSHYAPFLKPDDLLYPCNAVGMAYKEECYKMQTSYALSQNGRDFRKLFAMCAQVEEGFAHTCAQSIGRDASGQSVSNQERTIATCSLGENDAQQADCYIGAVKDFVSYFHSDKEARALCFAIPSRFQAVCEDALLVQWSTIK